MRHIANRSHRLAEGIIVLGIVLTLSFTLGASPGGKGGGGKPPKDPPPPPPPTGMANPDVAFQTGINGELHLTDGTDVALVYAEGTRSEISNDGTKISFNWEDDVNIEGIYWIYADGSSTEPTFITSQGSFYDYHAWGRSLGGEEYIIFADYNHVTEQPDIWAVRPDGTGRKQLTDTPLLQEGTNNLAFSNSGQYFITGHEHWDGVNPGMNYLYELDAGMNVINKQPLTSYGRDMWFSADDQWIVASSGYFGAVEIIKYEVANPSNIIQMTDSVGWNLGIENPCIVGDDLIFQGFRDRSHTMKNKDRFYGRLYHVNFTDGSGFTEMLPGFSEDQRWPGCRRAEGSGTPLTRQASLDISAIKPFIAESAPADAADLVTLLGAWGDCPPPCPQADFNRDGAVDLDDLLMFLNPATRPATW